MSRECRKCGEIIPLRIQIGDKTKSLKNRKYCIKCSPYRDGKTSIDGLTRTEIYRKSEKYREAVRLSLYKRGLQRKQDLIKMSGGCCSKCGYNKNNRALNFHHVDRTTKSFGLSLNLLWARSWESIIAEWKKCILVCSNCHCEIEDDFAGQGKNIVDRVNEKYGTNF